MLVAVQKNRFYACKVTLIQDVWEFQMPNSMHYTLKCYELHCYIYVKFVMLLAWDSCIIKKQYYLFVDTLSITLRIRDLREGTTISGSNKIEKR